MDRAGLRRKLLKAQAEAGDIVLLFADESEALTHPYLAHVWAKKGADLRIPAPGQSAKVAMLGVLDWARRDLIVRTSRTKRSADFIALLEEVDRRYGPKLGVAIQPLVLVLDNGPIHTSKASRAALAERALAGAEEVLSAPVADRPNWTLPRLADEIERRAGLRISRSRLSVVLRQKGISAGGVHATR